jgi:hypothetical protein
MKAFASIVAAFLILAAGWLFLAGLLFGVGYLGARAGGEANLMYYLNVFLMWLLGPGFGGFLASYVTPQLFTSVKPETIFVGFISVLITLSASISILSIVLPMPEKVEIGEFLIFVLQVSAIVVGAKIGKSSYEQNYS